MTKIKLNPKYPNQFLNTQRGHTFYQEGNVYNGKATVLDIDLTDGLNFEAAQLVSQGILQVVVEPTPRGDETGPAKVATSQLKPVQKAPKAPLPIQEPQED